MRKNSLDKNVYAQLMQDLKRQNEEYRQLMHSREFETGSLMIRFRNSVSRMDVKSMLRFVQSRHPGKDYTMFNIERGEEQKAETEILPDEYFSDERIAVYTCIFGEYDRIQEPVCSPDNIDYYIITDQELPEQTRWIKKDEKPFCEEGWSVSEKNRFVKMHPDLLFPEYRYSIYVDGNIKVITDLTPYIYRLGSAGIGMHHHAQRDCAYAELKAAAAKQKVDRRKAEAYRQYLKKQGLPEHCGLLEGNVIVREHHNRTCRKIMAEWWMQFRNKIPRDQVSLPLVLWKNGIKVDDIGVLGYNVYENNSFRVRGHRLRNEQ